MVSTTNNFSLEDLGSFLKLLDEEMFTSLLEQTLQVIRTISTTGIFQTVTDFEPAIYKRLKNLQTEYSEELSELGVTKDCFNTFLFFSSTFKDAYTCLLYETAKNFMRKKEKESCAMQITINASNRTLGIPDFILTDMEIYEKSKHQSPVIHTVTQTKLNVQVQPYTPRGKKRVTYAEVILGTGSDDSQSTSLSLEKKWNTQNTLKKSSISKKLQQQANNRPKSLSLHWKKRFQLL